MDKVLIDCLILSVIVGGVLGCGAYFGGSPILSIYTEDPEVIKAGLEILSITTVPTSSAESWIFSGALRAWIIHRPHDPVRHRNCRHKNFVDLWNIPIPQKSLHPLYFLSGSWIITIIMQVICYYFVRKKTYGQEAEKTA